MEEPMKTTPTLIAIALAATLAGGCATQQQTETAVGTGAGAAAGAVLGTMIGGSGRGTVVGAAVGAGVGAAAGYHWPQVKEKLGIATKDSGVAVTEQKDGSLKVSVPGSVSFASGSAAIDTRLYPTLDKLANTLNEYPASTITVIGYTDSQGSAQDNLDLSNRRATAVANYLAQRGVQRNRMTVSGRGEAEPIADNATEAGRSQNRRVEMVIRPAQS
jgi:outer membrane protein OmpA-like peptidoglycan-associated protein